VVEKQHGFILISTLLLGALLVLVAGSVFTQARLSLKMAAASVRAQQQQFSLQQKAPLSDQLPSDESWQQIGCPDEYAAWSEPVFDCAVTEQRATEQQFEQISMILRQSLRGVGDETR